VRKAIAEVTVVDVVTQAPISDAEVMVLNYVDLEYHSFSTNKQGQVRFIYPYPDKPAASLEVRKDGYIPQRSGWGEQNEKGETPRHVKVTLRRGTRMGGVVVDESGQPIEGVTVVATVDEYGPGERLQEPLGHEMFYEIPFLTGRDGRWRTDSLPPTTRKVSLQLIHPDYVSGGCSTLGGPGLRSPSIESLRKESDRQVMTKGVRISGGVIDAAGNPIPRARVSDSSRGMTHLTYVRHTETDSDGRFHFHFQPYERLTLSVHASGFEPHAKSIEARPGIGPLEFRHRFGKVIRGRVVDIEGKPIEAACVAISNAGRQRAIFLRTWTDSAGQFLWGSAPPWEVLLSISKEGYIPDLRAVFSPKDQEKTVVLRPVLSVTITACDAETSLTINQLFSIEYGILDPNQDAIDWLPTPTSRTVGPGENEAILDATGGPYRLRVQCDGFEPAATRLIRGDEKDVREMIKLKRVIGRSSP
jgi:hypothetical protein